MEREGISPERDRNWVVAGGEREEDEEEEDKMKGFRHSGRV